MVINGCEHVIHTQVWDYNGEKWWESWMDDDQDYFKYGPDVTDLNIIIKNTLTDYGY